MKKISYLLLLALCISFGCQKDVPQNTEFSIIGKWKFALFINNLMDTVTAANVCFADNTIDFRDAGVGTLSQGDCLENTAAPRDLDFTWHLLPNNMAELSGDTVKILKLNDSLLYFKRIPPYNTEYHWKK